MFLQTRSLSAVPGLCAEAAARTRGTALHGHSVPGFTEGACRTRLFAKSHTHTFLLHNILGIYTDVLGKLSLA